MDFRTLQELTGHSQAATLLNIYAHSIQSAKDRAAKALEDVLLKTDIDGREKDE